MQTRKDWMMKYYTEEQRNDLRKRWSPEVQAESQRAWDELIRDAEAAIARREDPSGEAGQQLAMRRQRLLEEFTGGDPGIAESLKKLFADRANWPETFKKPYRDEVEEFLCEAAKEIKNTAVR